MILADVAVAPMIAVFGGTVLVALLAVAALVFVAVKLIGKIIKK